MKIKNTNFFQKHIEKLILGAAGVIALLVILVYAVGSPYTATIANQEMGPRKVEDYLRAQAQDLRAKLASDQPQFDPPEIAGYAQELASRLDTPPAPMGGYNIPFGRPGLRQADIGVTAPLAPYVVPRPPLATEIDARASFAVLGQQENADQHAQLVQLAGQKTPWDIRYVSVAAEWPIREWRERLEASALPVSFWRSMIGITSVYLQREELDPVTGEWGNPTIVPSLPAQLAIQPGEKGEYTDESANQLVRFIRERQANIARPDFPTLAHGVWLPPGSNFLDLTPEENRRLKELREDINALQKRIDQLHARAQRESQAQQRSGRTPPPRRGGGRDDLGGFGGDDLAGRGASVPSNASQEIIEQINRLTTELQQKRVERDQLIGVPQENLTDATQMMDPYMMDMYDNMSSDLAPGGMRPGMGDPRNPFARPGTMPQQPGQVQPGTEPVSDESIRVWAHDLTVEPGKTYRYRILVSVLNPLFRQSRVEARQRDEHFNQVALGPDPAEVAASPWSTPVSVDPEFHFFFLNGNVAGQVANVEVWHIHDGRLHKDNFQERPGDPIGGETTIQVDGVEQPLNLETGAVMVDLVAAGGAGVLGGDVRLLYVDPNRVEAIKSRSSQQDQNSTDRIRLENLRSQQEQQAMSSSASANRP